ncbi:class I SAM-dependent methyltransferase [Salinifilum aidingensis]
MNTASHNPAETAREYWTFARRALRAPATVGAVLPTSGRVGAAVAGVVPSSAVAAPDDGRAPVVVEVGPGTGALSERIAQRVSPATRQLAIEVDPELVAYLRRHKPWLDVIHGDLADLPEHLAERGIGTVDALVTSIPWTLLDADRQRRLLDVCARVLEPSAPFTTVTYVTTLWRRSTRDFLALLGATFDEVLPRSVVMRNVPPAKIYVCRRPKVRPR